VSLPFLAKRRTERLRPTLELTDRLAASRRDNSSNRDEPSGPSTTASPSIVKLLAFHRRRSSGKWLTRAVQLRALRLYSRTARPCRRTISGYPGVLDFMNPIGAGERSWVSKL
jgi:hypothetical protein